MAFGADDAIIAGIVALLAGTAANAYGQERQSKKAQSAADALWLRQMNQGKDINDEILKAADQYQDAMRNNETAQIAANLASQYQTPVLQSQSNRAEQQTTQGNVSNDYTTAKARQDAQSLQDVRDLASLMGKVNSASRLRMNEGFNLAQAQQKIAQMQKFNNMDNQLGLMKVNTIANDTNGWNSLGNGLGLLGTALTAYGTAGLLAAPAAAGSTAGGAVGTGLTATPVHAGVNSGLVAAKGATLTAPHLASGLTSSGLKLGALAGLSAGMSGFNALKRRSA